MMSVGFLLAKLPLKHCLFSGIVYKDFPKADGIVAISMISFSLLLLYILP
jgi:hypothetical protein